MYWPLRGLILGRGRKAVNKRKQHWIERSRDSNEKFKTEFNGNKKWCGRYISPSARKFRNAITKQIEIIETLIKVQKTILKL